MATKVIYRISFINQGQVYEIYAKKITSSELFGFIEAEDFIFNTKTTVVVDPAEERLKTEFNDVNRTFIPMHSVIRIDAMKKEGTAKIHELAQNSSTVKAFPNTIYSIPKPTHKGEK